MAVARGEERAMSFELSQHGLRKESEQGRLRVRESMLRTETALLGDSEKQVGCGVACL